MNKKYAAHLQSLASQWENLLKDWPPAPPEYYKLYARSKNILEQLCSDSQNFLDQLDQSPSQSNVEQFIGKLQATQFDLNDGVLRYQIQDEVVIDLLQQVDDLLAEGSTKANGHIPAAVLAGAVLENFLRALCARTSPPIPVIHNNGTNKTLGMLVGELEKIEFYNPVESKQITVWVNIRNYAAHGQFDQFNSEQVKEMIDGIRKFIAKHQAKA